MNPNLKQRIQINFYGNKNKDVVKEKEAGGVYDICR